MTFYYIRHGDPIYSPDSLTDLGHRQAEALAKRLSAIGLDRIFCSSSERAYLTAMHTAKALGMENDIVKLDFAHESKAWEEFAAADGDGHRTWIFNLEKLTSVFYGKEVRDLGYEWYDHPDYKALPFKAGCERIARDSNAFFASLGYERDEELMAYRVVKPNNEKVALFAHGGFGMSFLSHLLGIPYPTFCRTHSMFCTALTVIEFKEADGIAYPRVHSYANDGHLYAEKVPANAESAKFGI